MTTTIGIRELARGSSILKEYDYVNIEDKKTHQRKGLIVSDQYADEVEKYLKKIIAKKKQQRIDKIMKMAGTIKMDEKYKDMNSKELRRVKNIVKKCLYIWILILLLIFSTQPECNIKLAQILLIILLIITIKLLLVRICLVPFFIFQTINMKH